MPVSNFKVSSRLARLRLFGCVAGSALATATAALAQQAGPPPTTPEAAPPGSVQQTQAPNETPQRSPVPGPAASNEVSEIIVTGQRRLETLTQAPVAVSAFNEATIAAAGITRAGDFLRLTPNVTFVQSSIPGEFFVTIRGNTQTRNGESSTALVIDGVQQLDQNSVNQELFDVKQIEVLKGPQGALYGRNAIGGAIVINTKDPSNDALDGSFKVGIGNGREGRAQAVLSGPIIKDVLTARAGFSYLDRAGFYKNDLTGERVDRFRDVTGFGRLLWTPNDKLRVDLNARVTRMDGGGIYFNALVLGLTSSNISGDNVSVPYTANIPGYSRNDRTTLSLKADYDLGFATLTSITAYANVKDSYGGDSYPYLFDPSAFDTDFPGATPVGLGAQTQALQRFDETWYEELRLSSPQNQRLRWIIGAYYAHFDIFNSSTVGADRSGVNLGPGPFPFASKSQTLSYVNDTDDNRAYAFYGNLDFDLTKKIALTAALRYDNEDKEQTDQAFAGPPDPADPKKIPTYSVSPFRSRTTSFNELEPKFTGRYSFNDDISVYVSYARGFKSGGFNPFNTAAQLRVFNPNTTVQDTFPKEVADSYELGFKSRLFARRVRLNAAVFHVETDNAQLLEFIPQLGIQAISTADQVETTGGEFDTTINVLHGFEITAGLGYIDSHVTKFTGHPEYVGNSRPSTSDITANLAGQYRWSLPRNLDALIRVDYQHQGVTFWDWANTPGTERSPYDLVNARLSVSHGPVEVALYGRNLFDKLYNSENIVLLPFASAVFRAPPRTYGVEASYRF